MLGRKYKKYRYFLIQTLNQKLCKEKILQLASLKHNRLQLNTRDFYFKTVSQNKYIIKIDLRVYNVVPTLFLVLQYFDIATSLISSRCINQVSKYINKPE